MGVSGWMTGWLWMEGSTFISSNFGFRWLYFSNVHTHTLHSSVDSTKFSDFGFRSFRIYAYSIYMFRRVAKMGTVNAQHCMRMRVKLGVPTHFHLMWNEWRHFFVCIVAPFPNSRILFQALLLDSTYDGGGIREPVTESSVVLKLCLIVFSVLWTIFFAQDFILQLLICSVEWPLLPRTFLGRKTLFYAK